MTEIRSVSASLLLIASCLVPGASRAQGAGAQIAAGDKAYAARDAAGALKQFQAALKVDSTNVQALWKASAVSVALGEFADEINRDTLYEQGERYARRAMNVDSTNADVRFSLVNALGRIALTKTVTGRAGYAKEIYNNVNACLKIKPKHPECLHALGEWNAQAMRIDSNLRDMAISFLGVKELENASWTNANKYLEEAAKLQPKRVVHRLDLGRAYADQKMTAKAKTELDWAMKLPLVDFNDPGYKSQAAAAMKRLAGGK